MTSGVRRGILGVAEGEACALRQLRANFELRIVSSTVTTDVSIFFDGMDLCAVDGLVPQGSSFRFWERCGKFE
jgi:hypothetical protein